VGFARKRVGGNGRPRYTAYYRDTKDRECSAGTFPNKKDADRAWQRAEAKIAEGRLGDPGRGRQTFQAYAEQVWLPGHQIEATTRRSCTYSLYKHLMPEFGPMRMIDILPERLGHASIATTEKYLHTLPDTDDSTLDAFTRIRERTLVSSPRRRPTR
jgi:integrase